MAEEEKVQFRQPQMPLYECGLHGDVVNIVTIYVNQEQHTFCAVCFLDALDNKLAVQRVTRKE